MNNDHRSHPLERRLRAEEFVRIRRATERRRFVASQRRGRVDPNPHQIDAVAFALQRIPDGGCILADEVGLGKTIEAGLVIAQVLAEGFDRILLIVPKSLLGQWQTELYTLFGIEAREGYNDPESFAGSGVFLVTREFAGGVRTSPLLSSADPFDLVVIDEAHEMFAGIYKRFNSKGDYVTDSRQAQTADRVRTLIKSTRMPVLLLTATPIQNTLSELWGLVHFVEPNDQLLGTLPTFRKVFRGSNENGEDLDQDQAFELRRRLKIVLQRTLRRQAQEFLEVPFVDRQAKIIEYSMAPDEKKLYEDVTTWLMAPSLFAFKSANRRILTVGFHRRMASSIAALKASLENVAKRLREELAGKTDDVWGSTVEEFAADLEDDLDEELSEESPDAPSILPEPEQQRTSTRVKAELERVEGFVHRAGELSHDSKAECLLTTLKVIREQAEKRAGTGKTVIFTESIQTQEFLFGLLTTHGYSPQDVTLFRGSNNHPRALEALDRWEQEVGSAFPTGSRPSKQVAIRLALVHEFRHQSSILIATEAGAKGLNLQFCETLINYDLPWNPQRIEQRIGRIHRYGQQRGVTVFNFLDRGNEAQRLTFEILSRKLDLFGKVLDASDAVLHAPDCDFPEPIVSGIGVDFEKQLRRIYQQSSSIDEVTRQLHELRDSVDEKRRQFDEEQARAAELIENRLDDSVSQVFRQYQEALPSCLQEIDHDIDILIAGFLSAIDLTFDRTGDSGQIRYTIPPCPALPEKYQDGGTFLIGDSHDLSDGELLYPGHPLIQAAVSEARAATNDRLTVQFSSDALSESLRDRNGQRGRMVVLKLRYRGLAPVDRILRIIVMENELDALEPPDVEELLSVPAKDLSEIEPALDINPDVLDDAIEEALLVDQAEVTEEEERLFERKLEQLDRYLEDRVLVLKQHQSAQRRQLEEAERKQAKAASPTSLSQLKATIDSCRKELQKTRSRIDALQRGEDPNYQEWRTRLFEKRFQKPEMERICEADFCILPGDAS